jgi:cytochrome c-type biogenesis protein CcmE
LSVLVVFGAVAFMNLNKTMAPYVTFTEAKASERAVQVAGFPNHAKARFDPGRSEFRFEMRNDAGDLMPVAYRGVKPGNFDQAETVVVVGRYAEGVFQASQILVKCPSKYEARGDQHPGADAATTGPGT